MEQYYTPEIEDIRVGYECEFTPSSESKDGGKNWIIHWKSVVVDSKNIQYLFGANAFNQVRVPYLTKEQIEAEGWERYKKNIGGLEYSIVFYKNTIEIYEMDETGYRVCKYNGNCPSINEFRTICKLLNIK